MALAEAIAIATLTMRGKRGRAWPQLQLIDSPVHGAIFVTYWYDIYKARYCPKSFITQPSELANINHKESRMIELPGRKKSVTISVSTMTDRQTDRRTDIWTSGVAL